MADNNIEAKVREFAELKSKAEMRDFIDKTNENIISFKNRIGVTGSVSTLIANYRAHLERVASGEQSHEVPETPSSSRAKGKQRATTVSTASLRGNDGDFEDIPDKATGLLSKLMIQLNPPISRVTKECLNVLGSSLRIHPTTEDDFSYILQPLFHVIFDVVRARNMVPLSYNHAENYQRLSQEVQKMKPVDGISHIIEPLVKGIGVEHTRRGTEDDIEVQVPAALVKELDLLSDEIHASFERWSSTFPPPPAEEILYPLDFTREEKHALRRYAKGFLEENLHIAEKNAKREDIQEALSELRANWPIAKGNMQAIAQLLLDEVKSSHSRSKPRSRSRSLASPSLASETTNAFHESSVGGELGDLEDESHAREHCGTSDQLDSRKRSLIVNSDEDDGGEDAPNQSKAKCTERRGTRSRSQ
ncbi:hypothetical protein COCMIDRAFT_455 [Bipolaris oryzae ATCC 44560]|uniref:Uncharacterized protein n=1 Tax=Bipolaris oryzae ATCC 44560 TaxID=930090 RepID=W6ZLR2_COCMI|nr:uncharacterized protein COCMIDRAFT_455 [Bipolaris oryzae ATCC 44560]EUC50908.1 hypothetical protein COCMIDRAFT_455 [Bipolaris oryzae ATCC 44560]